MGVVNDIKGLMADVKGHFKSLSAAKEKDYAGYNAAADQVKQDFKTQLGDTVNGIKTDWAAAKGVRKAKGAEKGAEKQFDRDFVQFMQDLEKVEELQRQLAAAQAKAQKQLGAVQTSAQNLENAQTATEKAKDNLAQVSAQNSATLAADSKNLTDHAQAAKVAGEAAKKAYSADKAAANAAFKEQVGGDLRQLGHDAKVAAEINGIRVGTGAALGAQAVADVAIAMNAPYALPAVVIPQVYASKQLVDSAQKKIDGIRAAEAAKSAPTQSGSGTESKKAA